MSSPGSETQEIKTQTLEERRHLNHESDATRLIPFFLFLLFPAREIRKPTTGKEERKG